MNSTIEFTTSVWGDYACFTQPKVTGGRATRSGRSRQRNTQLPADRSHQRLGDFAMARDRGPMAVGGILEDAVTLSLASQHATMEFQMPNQIAALHGVGAATVSESCWPV